MASDASHMLEAALEQMDDIIAGSKAAADYSNGLFEIGSPVAPPYLRSLQILQLVEELRVGLELMNSEEEVEEIRNQIPTASAQAIIECFCCSSLSQNSHHNIHYQDRLTRLESDKESLVLQVSVLTDQVEAQGEKIRDLEACLEEHQLKLNSTEEMLQQELISRTALESQKLDLMAEVSNLKIKLAGIEKDQEECEEKSLKNEGLLLELRSLKCKVEELENEKNQYEKKLKTTKAEITELQEQLLSKDMEIERLQSQLSSRASVQSDGSDREIPRECFYVKADFILWQDRRIEELSRLLNQYKMMKQMVLMAQVFLWWSLVQDKLNFFLPNFHPRIRRTHSSTLAEEEEGPTEFRRGGLRATAGPCLARSTDTSGYKGDPKVPFAQWTTEQVCSWLQDCGLGQYAALARQWVTSGQTLLSATPQELEKELGIKHSLHRKKIQLVQKTIGTKQDENPGKLDHIWVTRWLDDIGLPQYKDQFNEARVDGRMLQYLTVNDLLFLKVTSQLHHLSIKCAIHVLHVNKFNPNCLRRRPADESKVSPSDVAQWSNHRVMEWLRSVDLAEYAPNLRGSGVHGGLAVLEPRFNSETLALLLNIPPQKTLLRRHLTTHFNLLIGPESQHEKREILESSSYTPLNTTAKVRPKKLGFSHFGNLRKKKLDECTDYICPLDTIHVTSNGSQKSYAGYRGKKAVVDRELNKLEQVGNKS
uniref:PPFIA binding protein 2 n=1 Tax=Callorhinchus milii TaxID=7868 RepID=A0A4W3GCD6_CALMI